MFTSRPRVAQLVETFVDVEPNDGILGFEAVVDNVTLGAHNVDIAGGGAVYDAAIYDTDTYGGSGRKQVPLLWDLNDGLTFYARITYTGQSAFRLFGYALGLQPEGAARGF